MLYWLSDFSTEIAILNIFRYLTFRAGGAVLTAMLIAFICAPPLIKWLKSYQNGGQPIRTDGPQSHIITKKLYDEDIAFTLQNDDNRIVFVIPYKEEFSLIGTTEVDVNTPDNPSISDDEKIYLINSINNHFVKQISQVDIIDTYSGIRPLIEDFKEASKVSRDYVFDLNIQNIGSPLLNIYGGKLTTYRKLSEKVMEELTPYLPDTKTKNWTATKQL